MEKMPLTSDKDNHSIAATNTSNNQLQLEDSTHSELELGDRFHFGIPAFVFLCVAIGIGWKGVDYVPLELIVLLASIVIACITQSRIGKFAGSIAGSMIFAFCTWSLLTLFPLTSPLFSFESLWRIIGKLCLFVAVGLPALSYVLTAKFGFSKSIDK